MYYMITLDNLLCHIKLGGLPRELQSCVRMGSGHQHGVGQVGQTPTFPQSQL